MENTAEHIILNLYGYHMKSLNFDVVIVYYSNDFIRIVQFVTQPYLHKKDICNLLTLNTKGHRDKQH